MLSVIKLVIVQKASLIRTAIKYIEYIFEAPNGVSRIIYIETVWFTDMSTIVKAKKSGMNKHILNIMYIITK